MVVTMGYFSRDMAGEVHLREELSGWSGRRGRGDEDRVGGVAKEEVESEERDQYSSAPFLHSPAYGLRILDPRRGQYMKQVLAVGAWKTSVVKLADKTSLGAGQGLRASTGLWTELNR